MTRNNRSVLIVAILFLFISKASQGQIAIGTGSPTPDASSMLDIQSNSKGVLVPRMIQAERTAIVSPATGLLIYQTDGASGFYYNVGTPGAPNWTPIVAGNGGGRWDLLQNPAGHLTLAHGADTTSFSFDGVTNKKAFTMTSNSLTSGSLLYLKGTSTASSGYSAMLNIFKAGANTNSNVISAGISTTVTNTGVNSNNYGGDFFAGGGNFNVGVGGTANGKDGIGVWGYTSSPDPSSQTGVMGTKSGNTVTGNGIGVQGVATGTGSTNKGGDFYTAGASSNYGVYSYTDADGGYGIYGMNSSTGTGFQRGVTGVKMGNTGTGIGMAISGTASGTGTTNYGGNFSASGANMNFGVYSTTSSNGFAIYGNNSSTDPGSQVAIFGIKNGNTGTATGTGVKGQATGTGATNIGGDFFATGASGSNYGVYSLTDANAGIGVYGANASTGTGTQVGVLGSKSNNTGTGSGYGVQGTATGTGTINYGGNFAASGASFNIGAEGSVLANLGTGIVGNNTSSTSGTQVGVDGRKSGSIGAGGTGYGVKGSASGSADYNYGGNFYADGAAQSYGVSGQASSTGNNIGGDFSASGGTFNKAVNALTTDHGIAVTATNSASGTGTEYALMGTKSGNLSSGNGYAVYAEASGTATRNVAGYFSAAGAANNYAGIFDLGNVGIGTASPTHKLEVSSSVNLDAVLQIQNTLGSGTSDGMYIKAGSNGAIGSYFLYFLRPDGSSVGRVEQTTAGGVTFNTTSDKRLKNIIGETGKGLNDLMKIKIYDYTFKTDENKTVRTGFVAQELYDIFPQAVSKPRALNAAPEKDPWMVDYGSMTPLIIKAVQDQQVQMQKQEAEMESLRAQVKEADLVIKALAERLAALEKK